MNKPTLIPITHIDYLCRTPELPVAIREQKTLCWQQLFADVHGNSQKLQNYNSTDWSLYHDDSYLFLVGFLSLLQLGKTVYLPGNNLPGTIEKLEYLNCTQLGQFPGGLSIKGDNPLGATKPIQLTGQVIIFTSGSTGAPKKISKSLQQLDNEIQTLEKLWGKMVVSTTVLATVSHQHIYGLLFKILWPFLSGRPFVTKTYRDPATLLSDTESHKRAIWIASPAHLNRCSSIWPWRKATQYLCKIFSSGGPLTIDAAIQIHALHEQYPLEIFGSSESGGIAWREQVRETACWIPLPGVEVRTNSIGALEVRSPHTEKGKWLPMNDAAQILPKGYFTLGDRLDRIVKIEEKRVSLPEVERQLEQHPWITNCRALVIKHQRTNIAIAATLSTTGREYLIKNGKYATGQQLKDFLKHFFDAVTLPRMWRFPSQLPTNSQGKILLKEIESLFNDMPIKRFPTEINCFRDNNKCSVTIQATADISYYNGHFPDFPILPGVVQISWAEHWGRKKLGIKNRFLTMEAIKFKQFIRPGTLLTLELQYKPETGKLNFLFRSDAGEHSFGRLVFECE